MKDTAVKEKGALVKIESFKMGNLQEVTKLEERLEIKLPASYKDFLSKFNGARIIDGYFFVKGLDQKILMHILYGINLEKKLLI